MREPWTLLHLLLPSSLLIHPPRQGDGTSGTFWPMKGQLILQGQRDSCLEAEKLALCLKGGKGRQGKQIEALLSSFLAWPVPSTVGLDWELRSWGGHQDRPCLSAAGRHPAWGWESQPWGGNSDHYSSPAFLSGWRHFWKVLGSGAQR